MIHRGFGLRGNRKDRSRYASSMKVNEFKPGPLLGFSEEELKARIVAKASEVYRLTEQLKDARKELENAQEALYRR